MGVLKNRLTAMDPELAGDTAASSKILIQLLQRRHNAEVERSSLRGGFKKT
jgi:hypothetical protein